MLISIKDTWCLVLGASSGIGAAIARTLAAEGVHVIGVHFDTAAAADDVARLVAELREHDVEAHFFNVNAASRAARAELVPKIGALTGGRGLHVLVHSLAFGTLVPYLPRAGHPGGITQRQMAMTLDVMAHSLVYWVQDLRAARLLPRGSKVFAMTSAGVSRALPSYGAVSAAKSALEAHVRQLGCELAPHGVAVNALRAGVTLTPALLRIPGHEEFTAAEPERIANPHGRLTRPEDVGEAVALLAGTDSSWITANTIGVDGGEFHAAGTAWNASAKGDPHA